MFVYEQKHVIYCAVPCGAIIIRSIFLISPQKNPYGLTIMARYGVSFVGSHSYLYSFLVTVVI